MQSKNKPRISICIPNFNRSSNLDELLRDCKNQTVSPYEVLIQDNSSDVNERAKIDHVVSRYKWIKFERNRKNVGLVKNVNRVIQKAKGDYVAIVNNDDRLSKYYIEEIQKAIIKYPGYDVYTTNACAITDTGSIFGDYRLFNRDACIEPGTGIGALWKKFFINLISISGATIYRRRFIQNNPFDPQYGNETDLNNALRLLSRTSIQYVNTPIYYVGINELNASKKIRSTKNRFEAYIQNCMKIYSKYSHQFENTPQYLARPKTLFFLQMKFKYNYSISAIREMLGINTGLELAEIFFLVPMYVWSLLKQRLLFEVRKYTYQHYHPLRWEQLTKPTK